MSTHRPDSTPAAHPLTKSKEGPRRRPGGRSARVQAAAFEATVSLLQEKGYDSLSFTTIAERAGVHETSLYRRWGTKEQLVIEAISNQAAKDVPMPNTGSLREDLIEILHSLRTFLQTDIGQALVRTGIATAHIPAFNIFHKEYWRQRHALLRTTLFERAIAREEIAPDTDLQLLIETLIGVLYVRTFLLGEELDETLPERIVELVLPGVSTGKT